MPQKRLQNGLFNIIKMVDSYFTSIPIKNLIINFLQVLLPTGALIFLQRNFFLSRLWIHHLGIYVLYSWNINDSDPVSTFNVFQRLRRNWCLASD